MDDNPIGYINTLLRYYLHVNDPDALPDEAWAEMYKQLLDIRKKEAEQ